MTQQLVKETIHKLFNEIPLSKYKQPLINIRHRQFLPGSKSKNFPRFLTKKPAENQLKVVQINKSVFSETREEDVGRLCHEFYMENIHETPAILIKGLPIRTVDDFTAFTNHVGFKKFEYVGGSAFRERFSRSVYAASDEPPNYTIEPHNEMSYLQKLNSKILFCCIESATIGGDSPIVFNKDLMKELDENVMDKFAKRNMRYFRNLAHEKDSDYLTWQDTFFTKCQKEAEKQMKVANINCDWNEDGSLSMWNILPAFRQHPVTGEMIWFNQAHSNHNTYYKAHPDYTDRRDLKEHQYPFNATYGDGERIEDDVLDHIRSVTWSNAIPMKLEKGDVILLDNHLVQHCRMCYEGYRKLVVQLIE